MSSPGEGESGSSISKSRGWRGYLEDVGDWFAYKDKGEWLNDMKGSVSLTASIIATMTFQLATNPPGGVVQIGPKDNATHENCNPCPGEAVLGYVQKEDYEVFLRWNTVCFVASLSVCLLLVSGIPLNHRFPTWLLSIGMCITLTSLTFTYFNAASMVTPDPIWGDTINMFAVVLYVWIALLSLVGLILFIRLFVRGIYQWIHMKKYCNILQQK
ncbi:PGG domain [Sesbania bispinosa]|nr:PGG domain [Sesbania bispinosa]